MEVAAGSIYEAVVDFGVTGLVGTLGLSVLDNLGNTSVARTTSGIIEISPGVYSRAGNLAPTTLGQYTILWDDGSLAVGHTAIDSLDVTVAGASGGLPVSDTASSEICSLWASVDEMAACCEMDITTDATTTEWALQQASEMLYRLSGYEYPGICTATVRPCSSYLSCWAPGAWYAGDCGCARLSKIRLAGYPVAGITSVLIDGEVVPPSEYRVDRGRELVRLADADGQMQSWPTCQRLELSSGIGTFFVTYDYGQNPPLSGVQAAAQLACQIAQQCPGAAGGETGECALPAGTVRIARQGITIDTQALGIWLLGTQQTGMALVDMFLNVYGKGRQRRTALLVPEADPWPLRVG